VHANAYGQTNRRTWASNVSPTCLKKKAGEQSAVATRLPDRCQPKPLPTQGACASPDDDDGCRKSRVRRVAGGCRRPALRGFDALIPLTNRIAVVAWHSPSLLASIGGASGTSGSGGRLPRRRWMSSHSVVSLWVRWFLYTVFPASIDMAVDRSRLRGGRAERGASQGSAEQRLPRNEGAPPPRGEAGQRWTPSGPNGSGRA
jgi:hypothetical protein